MSKQSVRTPPLRSLHVVHLSTTSTTHEIDKGILDMFTKTFAAIAGLTFSLALTASARPAQAQTGVFSVNATAVTSGQPGAYSATTGGLADQTSASISSDPAPAQWGLLYADTAAFSSVDDAVLRGTVSAVAGVSAPAASNSNPQSSTEGRFIDRITVTSNSLPNGTPVTLTFRNAIDISASPDHLYYGSVTTYFQIGSVVASTRWETAFNKPESQVQSPVLEVKTTVGSNLYTSGKLNTLARAYFYAPGPAYNGSLAIDATASLRLESASADVNLVAASGIDYSSIGN
jgi:hypothetical protein